MILWILFGYLTQKVVVNKPLLSLKYLWGHSVFKWQTLKWSIKISYRFFELHVSLKSQAWWKSCQNHWRLVSTEFVPSCEKVGIQSTHAEGIASALILLFGYCSLGIVLVFCSFRYLVVFKTTVIIQNIFSMWHSRDFILIFLVRVVSNIFFICRDSI